MYYRTLLAILQSEADAPRVLDLALPLAARHGSHLIGLHAEALPIVMATPMGGPAVDLRIDMEAETSQRHEEFRTYFTERARAEGVFCEWRGYENVSGDAAISGIQSARSADLVIAQQTDPEAPSNMVADVEALLFETGRPVLLVPCKRQEHSAKFGRILLAWNGHKEASRAAFDALPLMKEADSVEVLCVDPESDMRRDAGVAGAAIAAALARHDVSVTYTSCDSGSFSHGEAILDHLTKTRADMLVMGAFGHSRLKEFVFGGATRTVLKSMPVPTLMSR